MSTNYPTSIDVFVNPLPTDPPNNPSHAGQHTNINDAMEAVQTYLGVSTSTDPATITGRVAALEAGALPVAWGDITGLLSNQADLQAALDGKISVGASIPWSTVTGQPTTLAGYGITDAYTKAESDARYPSNAGAGATGTWGISITGVSAGAPWAGITGRPTTLAGYGITDAVTLATAQTVTGQKTFSQPILFADGVLTGSIGLDGTVSPLSLTGSALVVESIDGIEVNGPYIILDTTNLQITMPGATIGSRLAVAGISGGVVSLGYSAPPPTAFNVQDTHDANVVIKASGAAPPTAWVSLGLQVTLPADAPAGSATLSFEMVLQNTNSANGVIEYGMSVNGGAVLTRDIRLAVAGSFNQSVALSIPLVSAYSAGDVIVLQARVVSNSNNNFNCTMLASPTDLAVLRFSAVGEIGSVSAQWGQITGTLSDQNDLQTALNGKADINGTNAGGTWPINIIGEAGSVDNTNGGGQLFQWTGTLAQYNAIATKDPNTLYNITDAETEANSVTDQGAGATLKFWYGTEAEYTAITTKDPATVYLRSA